MKVLVCSILFVLVLPLCLLGQTADGTIRGTVADNSGSVVPGVSITARNLDTGLTVTVKTTGAGLYTIPNLPPGSYSIIAEGVKGFKRFEQTGVTVQTSTTTDLNITLQLGAVNETVTVEANAQQIETSTSDVGTTVQTSLVGNLHSRSRERPATRYSSSPSFRDLWGRWEMIRRTTRPMTGS